MVNIVAPYALSVYHVRMDIETARDIIWQAEEAEAEQRAEFGSDCVAAGYDPYEWVADYNGFIAALDPTYQEAKRVVDAWNAEHCFAPTPTNTGVLPGDDDIPF